jgi:3-oxoacyl-[acyl-carrier protein] reductase
MNNLKTAVITGGSTGIGRHLALLLSEKNYKIILISRNEKKLKSVKEKIENSKNFCKILPADLSNENDIDKIVNYLKNNNNIDLLINNAGIGIFNKLQNISSKEWDIQMNTNLKAAFLMSKAVVQGMIKNKTGKIVFINSVAGLNPYPNSSAYVASKYGLRGFSSSLREELREHNIKVISVHPGAVNTPFWDSSRVNFSREEMLQTKDVADCIVNAILSPNNVVQEELVIRRTAGDF